MNKLYCGVDNGINGAMTVMKDGKIIDKIIMPTILSTKNKKEYDMQGIIKFLEKYIKATVILEKAHAMPILGSVQAMTFGKNYGIMLGILSTLKIRYHIVHAFTWQRVLFKDMNYSDTKQSSIIVAQRLFPNEDFRATERSKKAHDGMTDSALLAFFGEYYLYEKNQKNEI